MRRPQHAGFTLIELMISVVIVGILASVAIPSFKSYVYRGRAGCLDHAFATPPLANSVIGAAVWHINSDEPRCLDYNLEYNPEAFYRPDPFRSSDHDPVLIGIRLE